MSAMLIAAPFVHVFPFHGSRRRCCWGRRESWFDENNIIIGVCGGCCWGGVAQGRQIPPTAVMVAVVAVVVVVEVVAVVVDF